MKNFLKGYEEIADKYGEFSKEHIEFVKSMVSDTWLGAMLFCKIFMPRIFTEEFGVIHERVFMKFVDGGEFEGSILPRESGKCLSGNTLITMATGERKKITDVSVGEQVVAFNENNFKQFNTTVTGKMYTGIKHCIKMTTRGNKTIECSPWHKFLTIDGWKELQDLKIGDRIATPRKYKLKGKNNLTIDDAYLLGYMIADGAISSGHCSFTKTDNKIIEHIKLICKRKGFVFRKYGESITYGISNGARKYFKEYGLYGHKSTTKRVPRQVWIASEEIKLSFINAIISCDGYVGKRGIELGLANKELIKELQSLMLDVGIRGYYTYKYNKFNCCWTIRISDRESLNKIFLTCERKQKALRKLIDKGKQFSGSKVDLIPKDWRKYIKTEPLVNLRKKYGIRIDTTKYETNRDKVLKIAIIENNKKLFDICNEDVLWDKIESIEKMPEIPMYDIETINHSFIANDIVVHNTAITRGLIAWAMVTKWREFFVYVGNTDTAIRKNISWVAKEIKDNRMIKLFFGLLYNPDNKWSESEFELTNGAYISSMSRGKSARGLLRDKRPEFILIDDFEDDESANSMDQCNKADAWLYNNLIPGKSKLNGRVFMLGTIISEICVINNLQQNPSWSFDVCSILLTDEKGNYVYDKKGQEISFCEEIWPVKKVLEKRKMLFDAVPVPKHQTWFSEYMNMPTNTAKRGWKMEDIQYWDGYYEDNIIYHQNGQEHVTCYTALDLASLRSGTDFTCVTTWAIDKNNNKYELKTWRKIHTKTTEIVQEIFDQHKEFNTREVYVEAVGCQDLILDSFDEKALSEPSAPFLITIRKRSLSKADRIRGALQSSINLKKVFLKKGHCAETYIELEKFDPKNKKQNDDILDCMADIFTNGIYIENYDTIKKTEKNPLDVLFEVDTTQQMNNNVRKMIDY